MQKRPLVYVCSPYRGDIKTNEAQARNYCRKIFDEGYTPFAPHLLFTQFLDDAVPNERKAGMAMGLQVLEKCHTLIICGDKITEGMEQEIELAKRLHLPIIKLDEILPEIEQETKSTAMDKNKFWEIIDHARNSVGHGQNMYIPLLNTLLTLKPDDIIHWKLILNQYHNLSNNTKIRSAASKVLDGCTDDGFDYFREWLISQGKDVFMQILTNPDSLAEYDKPMLFEDMLYVANEAFEKKCDGNIYDFLEKNALSNNEKKEIENEIIESFNNVTKPSVLVHLNNTRQSKNTTVNSTFQNPER